MERDELTAIVSENIQSVMARKGMTAASLARRAHLNPTGIYDIISGKSKSPRLDTISKIAEALGVSVVTLLERQTDADLRDNLADALDLLPEEEQRRLLLVAHAWIQDKAAS